jgi:hypothetical protein
MMNTVKTFVLGAVSLAFTVTAGLAAADICAYENGQGQKIFADRSPGVGWKKRQCYRSGVPNNGKKDTTAGRSRPVVSATSSGGSSRSSLPRVTTAQQRQRDAQRRQILEDELKTEIRLLNDAMTAQVVGFAPASPDEIKDPELYEKRVGTLNQNITLHERNVTALKKELSNIK